jgi:SAM-dependent methyltransferase
MGFDFYSTRFIVLAKQEGVDFSRTLTLGRQNLNLGAADLEPFLQKVGIEPSSDKLLTIRASLPFADGLLEVLGAADLSSVDASKYEGATLIHDMNSPIPESMSTDYSLVIDFGTLEHIFNFPVAIRNCMKLLRVGGSFISATTANNYLGHGFYQFSPELFYRVFSEENGFKVEHLYLAEDRATDYWYEVPDPAAIKERVELRNSLPTLMLMRAKKIADIEPLVHHPQQSDYALQLWLRSEQTSDYPSKSLILRTARQLAPNWLRNLRSALLRMIRPSFSASYFKRVNSRHWRM